MYGSYRDDAGERHVGYLISFPSYDVVVNDGDSSEFYIDVTPEQRFLIWNLKTQRFGRAAGLPFSALDYFNTEGGAQAAIEEHCSKFHLSTSIYKVIPFEYPGEQE